MIGNESRNERGFIKMKKITALLLIMLLVFALMPIQPAVSNTGRERIDLVTASTPVNLGSPFPLGAVASTNMSATTRRWNEDENRYQYIVLSVAGGGEGSMLNVVCIDNPDAPISMYSFTVRTGTVWEMIVDSYGRVYIAGFGDPETVRLYRYSPDNDEGQRLEFWPMNGRGAVTGMALDDDDNLYFTNTRGTHPIFRFNQATSTFTNLGPVFGTGINIRAIAYHNGYLYGGENTSNARFFRRNIETGVVTQLPNPNIANRARYEHMRVVDNYLFALVYGAWHMAIFDLTTQQWIGNWPSAGRLPTGNINGFVYFTRSDRGWQRFNLETRAVTSTGANPSPFPNHGLQGMGIANLTHPTNPNLNGQIVVSVHSGTGHLDFINFATGSRIRRENVIRGAQPAVQNLGFLGDDFYASAYMGGPQGLARVNAQTGVRSWSGNMGQAEGFISYNNRLYIGRYMGARVTEFNPTNNSTIDFPEFGQNQNRPFAMSAYNNRLAVGTISAAGHLGGALTVYNIATRQQIAQHRFPTRGVSGVAYRDGRVWGSTTIYGGLGPAPTETRASLFIFDVASGEVIQEVTPLARQHIGQLAFAPDGRLWGISGGIIIEINPENLDIISQTQINTGGNDGNWRPRLLFFDQTGLMFANPGGTLIVFDPDSREWRTLATSVLHFHMNETRDTIVYVHTWARASVFRMNITNNAPTLPALEIVGVNTTPSGINSQVTLNVTQPRPGNSMLIVAVYAKYDVYKVCEYSSTYYENVYVFYTQQERFAGATTATIERSGYMNVSTRIPANASIVRAFMWDSTNLMNPWLPARMAEFTVPRMENIVTTNLVGIDFAGNTGTPATSGDNTPSNANTVLDGRVSNGAFSNNNGNRHRLFFMTFDISEIIDDLDNIYSINIGMRTNGDTGSNNVNSRFNAYLLTPALAANVNPTAIPTYGAARNLGLISYRTNIVWEHTTGLDANIPVTSPDILPHIRQYLEQNPNATTIGFQFFGTNHLAAFLNAGASGFDSEGYPNRPHLRIVYSD